MYTCEQASVHRMARRATHAPLRSSGSVSRPGKDQARRNVKTQSKKRAVYRSQNAFNVAADSSDDDNQPSNDLTAGVKSEDDEEIDSDEAFESGDEEKFSLFKFSGSTHRPKRVASERQHKIIAKPVRKEIDLDEGSGEERANDSSENKVAKRPSRNDPDSDMEEESASDFEDDEGDDLMDLSEMLGSSKSRDSAMQKAALGLDDQPDTLDIDEIPYSKFEERTSEQDSSDSESVSDDGSGGSRSSDDSDSASEVSDSSSGDQVHDLEQFVSNIEKERKRPSDTTIAAPAKSKRIRIAQQEMNEQNQESEYNLASSSPGDKLRLEDMLDSLGSQNLKTLKKARTLSAPLAKPLQDRMDRAAAYDTVKDQMTKWQPAVKQLREASVLKFPLNEAAKVQPNNNSLAATFKPTNALETEIDSILKTSGMQSEKQISAFEDLEMAKLSVEEVQKRRAELAIMRDLMFRQERKAKRQNKIKSKAYRKVHRKEREKLEAAMQEASGDTEDLSRKNEERRARERMELRHKNTGKWAQKMIGRADHGEGSRAAITEQLQRGEDLERKIRGLDNQASDESESENSLNGREDETEEPLPEKGVFSMKFMRDADARESQANKDRDDYEAGSDLDTTNNNGRRVFTPAVSSQVKPASHHQRVVKPSPTIDDTTTNKKPSASASAASRSTTFDDEVNPWLSSAGRTKAPQGSIISRDTDESLKFAAKLNKAKRSGQVQHQGNINATRLNLNQTLALKKPSDDSEGDAQDENATMMTHATGRPALQQADLVARAFAGDDVVAEFEADKKTVQQEDAPQDIDETLPGWGSWTGNGVKKHKNARKFTRHVEGIQTEKRQDAKLQHVIINEKRMKQAKPYMSQSVPFPFETKEQYERSLSLPIGPEWTTRTSFQKQITPHVIKKQGQVIAPMQKPFKE